MVRAKTVTLALFQGLTAPGTTKIEQWWMRFNYIQYGDGHNVALRIFFSIVLLCCNYCEKLISSHQIHLINRSPAQFLDSL